MDVLSDALAASAQQIRTLQQRNYDPAVQQLDSFLKSAAPMVTERGDDKTNVIDQGASVTYAMGEAGLADLFVRLEACRRGGAIVHFSERQGTPATPFSGLMLDFDLVLDEPPASAVAARAAGAKAAAQVPAVFGDRDYQRISTLVVRALLKDLVFPRTGEVKFQVFFIVRPAISRVPRCRKRCRQAGKACGDECVAYKYGIHLLIPGVQTTRSYKKYLISELRGNDALARILGEAGVVGAPGAPTTAADGGALGAREQLSACLDANSASVPVLFLGSCKRGGLVYPLGQAFQVSVDLEEMRDGGGGAMISPIPDDELARYNLCYELALCAKPPAAAMAAAAAMAGGADQLACGLVTSAQYEYRDEISTRVETVSDRLAGGLLGEDEFRGTSREVEELCHRDHEANYLRQMLSLLSEEYTSEYGKWRNVIFALANAGQAGNADYSPLARWFSQRSPEKWNAGGEEALAKLWGEALDSREVQKSKEWRPLTRRSIIFWARSCSPEKFRELSLNSSRNLLGNFVFKHSGDLAHSMIAKVLAGILKERFVVDTVEGPHGQRYVWLEFVSAGQAMRPGEVWKWRTEADPDELHKYLSGEFVELACEVKKEAAERQKEAEGDEQVKYYKEVTKGLSRSIRKLYDNGYKIAVVAQARYEFRRRGFIEKLDKDPDILGVANGILRLAVCGRPTSQLISGFHEWPVSNFTTVRYRPFDPKEQWTELLLGALKKIVPELDMRVWLMMFLSTGLFHGLKDPVLLFWVGSGRNAKTWVARMAALVVGVYATKLPISLLTAEREDPTKPNSALMRSKDKGFVYYEESNKCEVLNSSRLKELVNPGETTGQEKFKKQETFENSATPLSLSNHDFIVDTKDDGTWRRIRHYRAKAKFTPDPDPNNPYEHKDDRRFINEFVKDPDCQTAFLGILVFFWERLQAEYSGAIGDVPCPTLARETETYRNSQDVLNRFITERIVSSRDHSKVFSSSYLSTIFVEWYQRNIEIGSRRYIATEIIGDVESSILSNFLTTAPNGERVIKGCRCLGPDDALSDLPDGDRYIGGRGKISKADDHRFGPDGDPEPEDWWNWVYTALPEGEPGGGAGPGEPAAPGPPPDVTVCPASVDEKLAPDDVGDDMRLSDGGRRRGVERAARAEAAAAAVRGADDALAELVGGPAPPPAGAAAARTLPKKDTTPPVSPGGGRQAGSGTRVIEIDLAGSAENSDSIEQFVLRRTEENKRKKAHPAGRHIIVR